MRSRRMRGYGDQAAAAGAGAGEDAGCPRASAAASPDTATATARAAIRAAISELEAKADTASGLAVTGDVQAGPHRGVVIVEAFGEAGGEADLVAPDAEAHAYQTLSRPHRLG